MALPQSAARSPSACLFPARAEDDRSIPKRRTSMTQHFFKVVRRYIFRCGLAGALIPVLTASVAAKDRGNDGGKIGPYLAGHTSFIATEDSGRQVAVEVWYPADDDAVTRSFPEAV